MQILKAKPEQFDIVKRITRETISEIYPRFYPTGVVDFFLSHHSDENIQKDIALGFVFLLLNEAEAVGTVTIKQNEICRLFVLSKHQHKGFGRKLLDFAEEMIGEEYPEVCLASSLPAKQTYLKRGYVAMEAHTIEADNGDVLCYDWMKKNCRSKQQIIHFDGKKFVPKMNTENGEVDGQTLFYYHQRENVVWAEYAGGDILQGFLVGTADEKGNLEFTYQHINESMQIRIGKCNSTPVCLKDGRLEMHEEWQWLNGDESKGKSVLAEVL